MYILWRRLYAIYYCSIALRQLKSLQFLRLGHFEFERKLRVELLRSGHSRFPQISIVLISIGRSKLSELQTFIAPVKVLEHCSNNRSGNNKLYSKNVPLIIVDPPSIGAPLQQSLWYCSSCRSDPSERRSVLPNLNCLTASRLIQYT